MSWKPIWWHSAAPCSASPVATRSGVRHAATEIIAHSDRKGRERACCSTNSTLGGEAVR
jgi:hypothetical protein